MKKHFLIFSGFLLLSAVVFAQRTKKVVFVIADGIPADVIEKLETPELNKIKAAGRYTRMHVGGEKDTYSQTPTISAVGYNSLLTGVWVNKHNVPDNDITAPNYNYYNLFRLFKTAFPNRKTAVYSSWLDNRTKLALAEYVDLHADGYELDTVRFKHDKARDFMHHIDETVIAAADKGIREQAPDLSWIYLEYTDDMGHMHGDSPEFYNAVRMLDKQMGRIYEAITFRQQKYKEDWMIVITTDHGRIEKNGKDHGGQSARQRSTWMITNYKEHNNYAGYYEPAIVDIMPTITRYLGIPVPAATAYEVDGTSMIGKVSLAQLQANYFQGQLDLKWQSLQDTGKVKIWVTTTNHFKTGGKDEYKLLGEVPVNKESATFPVETSGFYKIVLETPANTINRWLEIQ
jgi:hypothetical protein